MKNRVMFFVFGLFFLLIGLSTCSANIFEKNPLLKNHYKNFLKHKKKIIEARELLNKLEAAIDEFSVFMACNYQSIMLEERKKFNTEKSAINEWYTSIKEKFFYEKEIVSYDTSDEKEKKISIKIPLDELHEIFEKDQARTIYSFNNGSMILTENPDFIQQYKIEVLENFSLKKFLGDFENLKEEIGLKITELDKLFTLTKAQVGVISNSEVIVEDKISEISQFRERSVKYKDKVNVLTENIEQLIKKLNKENLLPDNFLRDFIETLETSLQESIDKRDKEKVNLLKRQIDTLKEEKSVHIENLLRKQAELKGSRILYDEQMNAEFNPFKWMEAEKSFKMQQEECQDYYDDLNAPFLKFEEDRKNYKRQQSVEIYAFPKDFDFLNKSVSDVYVDLVILDLIKNSINDDDFPNPLSLQEKLNKFLVDDKFSVEQKRLVERYIWQKKDVFLELFNGLIAKKNFTKQTDQELLDGVVEMLRRVNNLESDGNFIGAKEYKIQKDLDYKLFYFIDKQKNKILDSRDFGLRFVFEEDEKQKSVTDGDLKDFLIKQYQISRDEAYLLFSYVKKFEDEVFLTPKDLHDVGLELQTRDMHFKNIINVCIQLDMIINDEETTLSEKIKRYEDFIKNDDSLFLQYFRQSLEHNDTEIRNNFVFGGKECYCFGEDHCTHKNTYAFIFSCISNYFSLNKSMKKKNKLHSNLTALLGAANNQTFMKQSDSDRVFQILDASTKVAMERFEKMVNQNNLKSDFEKIALCNIIKHRPDLIQDDGMSFKVIAKHFLVPCFSKILKSGTCDVSLLKEALVRTRFFMTDRQISVMLSMTSKLLDKKEISEEIKDVLIEYNAQIIALKKRDIKKFDIWNASSNNLSNIINKIDFSDVTESEKVNLHKMHLLFDLNYDFPNNLQEVYFDDSDCEDPLLDELNALIENDSSEDLIEKIKKYHVLKRQKKIQDAKDAVLAPLKGFLQQWGFQKSVEMYQGEQQFPPEYQVQQLNEFQQYDEQNKAMQDLFYRCYCENENLVRLYDQENGEKLENKYNAIEVQRKINTTFQGDKLW